MDLDALKAALAASPDNIPLLLLTACFGTEVHTEYDTGSAEDTTQSATATETPPEAAVAPEDERSNLYGYYVGEFHAAEYDETKNYTLFNKINISIDKIEGDKITGHSVVAGNDRPFTSEK